MIVVLLLSGIPYLTLPWVSGTVVHVRPGQNVTLFCDCKSSDGALIAWFRNCSHVDQPSLVLKLVKKYLPYSSNDELMSPLPRFQFVVNKSSNSYDLLITNVSESDEGQYFCGTDTNRVEGEKYITKTYVYSYGKATRIKMSTVSLNSSAQEPRPKHSDVCWTLLYSLTPSVALVSSLITLCVVCYQNDKKARNLTITAANTEKDDVCYAALKIRRVSQGPKRLNYSSDFSTYSAVKTSGV